MSDVTLILLWEWEYVHLFINKILYYYVKHYKYRMFQLPKLLALIDSSANYLISYTFMKWFESQFFVTIYLLACWCWVLNTYPNVSQISTHITVCQQNAAIKQNNMKNAENNNNLSNKRENAIILAWKN